MVQRTVIEELVKEAQNVVPSGFVRFNQIQSDLARMVPKMHGKGNKADRARTLLEHIMVEFIGGSNDLPTSLLVDVFAAIINWEEKPK